VHSLQNILNSSAWTNGGGSSSGSGGSGGGGGGGGGGGDLDEDKAYRALRGDVSSRFWFGTKLKRQEIHPFMRRGSTVVVEVQRADGLGTCIYYIKWFIRCGFYIVYIVCLYK
jgi:hypothetical protein